MGVWAGYPQHFQPRFALNQLQFGHIQPQMTFLSNELLVFQQLKHMKPSKLGFSLCDGVGQLLAPPVVSRVLRMQPEEMLFDTADRHRNPNLHAIVLAVGSWTRLVTIAYYRQDVQRLLHCLGSQIAIGPHMHQYRKHR